MAETLDDGGMREDSGRVLTVVDPLTGTGAFLRAAEDVVKLFGDFTVSDLAEVCDNAFDAVRTDFGARAAAVRRRFDLAHETGHVALAAHVAAVVDHRATLSLGSGKRPITVDDLLAIQPWTEFVVLSACSTGVTTGAVVPDHLTDTRPATQYSRLRAVQPDFFLPAHGRQRGRLQFGVPDGHQPPESDHGPLNRYAVRLFARALRAGAMATRAWEKVGSRVLAHCGDLAASALGRCLQPPDPAQPPGRRVVSRRRPARGPNTSWTWRSPVHGAAFA